MKQIGANIFKRADFAKESKIKQDLFKHISEINHANKVNSLYEELDETDLDMVAAAGKIINDKKWNYH